MCNLLLKRIREAEIAVSAEVAKYWRLGDARREKFERVARLSIEQVEDHFTHLKEASNKLRYRWVATRGFFFCRPSK